MGRRGTRIMSASLIPLEPLEQGFLTTVNWMEVCENKRSDYLTNPGEDSLYVVDLDFNHFCVTLMGHPERTKEFRESLGIILEGLWEKYANSESWKGIQFGS